MNERAKVVAVLDDETEVASDCILRRDAEMKAYEFGDPAGFYVGDRRVVSMVVIECEGAE